MVFNTGSVLGKTWFPRALSLNPRGCRQCSLTTSHNWTCTSATGIKPPAALLTPDMSPAPAFLLLSPSLCGRTAPRLTQGTHCNRGHAPGEKHRYHFWKQHWGQINQSHLWNCSLSRDCLSPGDRFAQKVIRSRKSTLCPTAREDPRN